MIDDLALLAAERVVSEHPAQRVQRLRLPGPLGPAGTLLKHAATIGRPGDTRAGRTVLPAPAQGRLPGTGPGPAMR
ncbi:hypothetical protein SCA03_12220 [Streptomyces cacaoi]|uniref:Uncharacterized protein n=1 Tax=Streptomyces cacaoi TaxID=1898 RepID=A0A4Y3QTW2_STRCI|nr:hypothetical protein SCA03_12220 [Streptomyces cacaoi]